MAVTAVTRWLIDSGSALDLASERGVRHLGGSNYELEQPVHLQTANGPSRARKAIEVTVPELDESIHPLVVASSPPLLSLGKRCMEDGYSFEWRAGCAPVLTLPSGRKLALLVDVNCPFIPCDTEF